MDIRKLQRAIVDGLEDVKGQHIAVFNTEHLSAMFERVIIASGTSNRQTKALAASVRDSVKKRGMEVMATEGEDNGEWIIVDCGAAVAHIMQPAIREYYHLEEIWGGKAVRMKVGEVNTKLVKASEPVRLGRSSAAKTAYKAALAVDKAERAGATTAKKSGPRAVPFKRKATPGSALPAKPVVAKKPANKPAVKTIVVKPPAAKKSAHKSAGRTAAKTAPKRSPACKSTTRG